MSRGFWRVSVADDFGNPISFYVESGDELEIGIPGVSLTEEAWQEVFRRLRERTKG